MNHQCSHGCKHERLKFCDKCKKVHCLDCGTEWPKQEVITYPVYPHVSPNPWKPYDVWYGTSTGTATYSDVKAQLT
jgi:hypothetical protein